MPTEALEKIIEELKAIPKERDQLQELTKRIYDTIPEMFEKRLFEPVAIEITYSNREIKKIYSWQFAENIARVLLGYEIEKVGGDSWENAQIHTKSIK